MARRLYRFGDSSQAPADTRTTNEKANKQIDRDPVRLRTAIHFSTSSAPRYRVIARLVNGGEALMCLGANREEALATARKMGKQLPETTLALRLQRWVGGLVYGQWRNEKCERNELPFVPTVKSRRHRV